MVVAVKLVAAIVTPRPTMEELTGKERVHESLMKNLVVLTNVVMAIMVVVVGLMVVEAIAAAVDTIEVGKDSSNSGIVRIKAFGEGGGVGGADLYYVVMVVVEGSITGGGCDRNPCELEAVVDSINVCVDKSEFIEIYDGGGNCGGGCGGHSIHSGCVNGVRQMASSFWPIAWRLSAMVVSG